MSGWPPSQPEFGPAFTPPSGGSSAKPAPADRLEVTHNLKPDGALERIALSNAEQTAIAAAFRHALTVGAPGIGADIREAIVISAMVRVRHKLAGDLA